MDPVEVFGGLVERPLVFADQAEWKAFTAGVRAGEFELG
jgi:hypothetical protein